MVFGEPCVEELYHYIYLNGVPCDYPIDNIIVHKARRAGYNAKAFNPILFDEVGQWRSKEDLLMDEIIQLLNED